MLIKVSTDFSKVPGSRYTSEGDFSGEEFRDTVLIPKYLEAEEKDEKIIIDLDGCYGFATSFLEETFGGLVRKLERKNLMDRIEIIANDDTSLKELIYDYVKKAEAKL